MITVIILPKLFGKEPVASEPGREAGKSVTSTGQKASPDVGSRIDTSGENGKTIEGVKSQDPSETPATGQLRSAPDEVEVWAASVVKLEVYNEKGSMIGTGSGFAAFDEPVLITACHVIVNMDHMVAIRDDGTSFELDRVIAVNEAADVAVCALPEDAALTPLPMAESPAGRGKGVIAIGSQFGLRNLVTLGNVCGTWNSGDADWILFTAPVSSGSSGGPLLNEEGEVLGIITGTYDKGQNLNLAAPMSVAYSVAGRRPATIGD